MDFPEVPGPESQFEAKIKSVKQVEYTTDKDLALVPHLVEIVMVPPWNVQDSMRFLNDFGSIVMKIFAVDDVCGHWTEEADKCQSRLVLFVYVTPRQPDADKATLKEFLRKLKAAANA